MASKNGGYASNKRPHSPSRTDANNGAKMQKGQEVQFFFEADASKKQTPLVLRVGTKSKGAHDFSGPPRMLQSHGWLNGTLEKDFDPSSVDPSNKDTWALVLPRSDYQYVERNGKPVLAAAMPQRALRIRKPSTQVPLISVAFVRWGGNYSKWMDDQEENDGDWGKYGSPPSDEYMGFLVNQGLLDHPVLRGDDHGGQPVFELNHIIIKGSKDAWDIAEYAKQYKNQMRGQKRALFWMLWPAEWEDNEDPDYACYVERQAYFAAQRACEGIGLKSAFPHPADQFELITSKSWMATLSLHPRACLPACTLVTKGAVTEDVSKAARNALNAMNHIRQLNPYQVEEGDPPAPSVINKDGVVKGVVKLGWSWENRFVVAFNSVKQLENRLREMMTQDTCLASYCVVQEWVDFDFEMRLYMLPPADWPTKYPIEPTMIQCNAWGPPDETKSVGVSRASFSKLSEEGALKRWEGDTVAWAMAKEKATKIGNFLLAWLMTGNAEPVPMIRLDFMLKRTGPGKARVVFGEYCEMGACCLGWVEGPPTIWKATLDACLR
eukprot:TRINITY_DN5338_c2_g1_i1.p1 TRINITY_DN5338_c2_g1~~TRINITY_DN5338_c2_g1_i1.p1  ORF type:complete len:563 (-),score=96.79 TRINITY_DN5338_c2_g1_i1:106-1755(-)